MHWSIYWGRTHRTWIEFRRRLGRRPRNDELFTFFVYVRIVFCGSAEFDATALVHQVLMQFTNRRDDGCTDEDSP